MIRSVSICSLPRMVGLIALIGACSLLTGCGGKPAGKVSGTVTLKGGQPLTTGTVNFYSDKGNAAVAKLDGSGKFTFDSPLPAGTYKVYVSPNPPQQLAPGSKQPKMEPFPVSPKYQDPGQTPISKEVKAGANDIPIEIGT